MAVPGANFAGKRVGSKGLTRFAASFDNISILLPLQLLQSLTPKMESPPAAQQSRGFGHMCEKPL